MNNKDVEISIIWDLYMNNEHVKKQASRMGGHEPTHANLITALLYATCYVLKYGAKQKRIDAAAAVGRGKHKLVCARTQSPPRQC